MPVSTKATILLFAEDPGGANQILHIAGMLDSHSFRVIVLSDGVGVSYFRERGCRVRSLADKPAAEWLSRSKADIVICGTSANTKSFGLQLIKAAQRKGIPAIGAVDAIMNSAYRFRGETENPLFFAPDWLLVPDENISAAFAQCGFPADRILRIGFPQFAEVAKKRNILEANRRETRSRILPPAAQDRTLLVFVAEPPLAFGQDTTADSIWEGWGATRERTHVALQEIIDIVGAAMPQCFLVLRLHPRDNPENYEMYEDKLDYVSSSENGLQLVSVADLVVGTTSSLLFEAAVLNRPVISAMVRQSERHWIPPAVAPEISIAKDPSALAQTIRRFLTGSHGQNKTPPRFMWDERGNLLNLICCLSGKAHQPRSIESAGLEESESHD